MNIGIFVLIIVSTATLGCADLVNRHVQEPARPSWIQSPEKVGFISVVGYAPKQASGDESVQYRIALMKARQELAQIVRLRVENVTYQSVTDSNGQIDEEHTVTTRLTSRSALSLNRLRESARWSDPASGGLYLLLELPE